jgi:hypothetical protein
MQVVEGDSRSCCGGNVSDEGRMVLVAGMKIDDMRFSEIRVDGWVFFGKPI